MRVLISKIMLVCFLAAAIVSKTDGASAANAIESDSVHIVAVLSQVFADTDTNAHGIDGVHEDNCACEAKSSKSASLICGVVLAIPAGSVTAYVPLSVRARLEWRNRFGPKFVQDQLKKPPRINL